MSMERARDSQTRSYEREKICEALEAAGYDEVAEAVRSMEGRRVFLSGEEDAHHYVPADIGRRSVQLRRADGGLITELEIEYVLQHSYGKTMGAEDATGTPRSIGTVYFGPPGDVREFLKDKETAYLGQSGFTERIEADHLTVQAARRGNFGSISLRAEMGLARQRGGYWDLPYPKRYLPETTAATAAQWEAAICDEAWVEGGCYEDEAVEIALRAVAGTDTLGDLLAAAAAELGERYPPAAREPADDSAYEDDLYAYGEGGLQDQIRCLLNKAAIRVPGE